MNLSLTITKYLGYHRFFQQVKLKLISQLTHQRYLNHYWNYNQKKEFLLSFDPVRIAAIILAVQNIIKSGIAGSLAEVGVFRGETSKIIHAHAPDRKIYLFDTFEGFPPQDLNGKQDLRFKDTNLEILKKSLGNLDNVIIKKGYFPETARGLENEVFSFVMLDTDLYEPTLAGLRFFYPRLVAGGYLFIHDFNSDESDHAVSKAANEFLADKPEKLIEIPDEGGTVILRKI